MGFVEFLLDEPHGLELGEGIREKDFLQSAIAAKLCHYPLVKLSLSAIPCWLQAASFLEAAP